MFPDMSKVTKNKDGKPRKTGSGRTKGATSLVKVSLGTLKEYLANDSITIPESTKVEYSLTNFDD